MDKQDRDTILNAYNLAKERLAKRQSDSGQVDEALQQSMVNVLKTRSRVRDLPTHFAQFIGNSGASQSWNVAQNRLKLPRRSLVRCLTWDGKTAFIAGC